MIRQKSWRKNGDERMSEKESTYIRLSTGRGLAMSEYNKIEPEMREALDFSQDSQIKETLLNQIKSEYFGALEDDELEFLNAAGPIDEAPIHQNQDES